MATKGRGTYLILNFLATISRLSYICQKNHLRHLFTLTLLLFTLAIKAQSSNAGETEYLKLPVEKSAVFKNETEFYNQYIKAAGNVLVDKPDKAFRIALELQRIAIKKEKPELIFLADYFLGRCYYFFNDSEKAVKCFSMAGKTAEQQKWYHELAKVNLFLGSVFQLKRNYKQAEQYFFTALDLATKHQVAPSLQMEAHEKIGYLYLLNDVDDLSKSRQYFEAGLKLAQKEKDTVQIGQFMIKVAQVDFVEKKVDLAMQSMYQAIAYLKKKKNKEELVIAYKSMGDMYYNLKENDSSLHYYYVCYDLRRDMGQNRVTAITACDVAYMYGMTGQYKLLDQFADTALKYVGLDRTGEAKFYVYKWLADIYNITKNKDRSLAIYKSYVKVLDSTIKHTTDDALTRQGLQMDFDKQMEIVKLQQEREKEIQEKDKENQRFLSRIYLVGLVVVLVFFFFISRELRRNKKQKRIIEQQNQEVVEKSRIIAVKNKEMTDSINYAQRIQAGLLPSKEDLLRIFPGSFLYYNPKDILSGDFYWYGEKGENVFIACGDCTGHGVPGALMSVLGINLLTDIIEGKNVTEPAEVLSQLREGVIKSLNKDLSRGEYKDGMDIALVRLNRKTGNCVYAGANNPAYHISGNELKEAYQANKQPVGFSSVLKPFDQQSFAVQKGDMIVLFTDGFPDQFGGPSGKKLMYKPFRQLLMDVLGNGSANREELLHHKFIEWRGNNEQIDDICVMGIKV